MDSDGQLRNNAHTDSNADTNTNTNSDSDSDADADSDSDSDTYAFVCPVGRRPHLHRRAACQLLGPVVYRAGDPYCPRWRQLESKGFANAVENGRFMQHANANADADANANADADADANANTNTNTNRPA